MILLQVLTVVAIFKPVMSDLTWKTINACQYTDRLAFQICKNWPIWSLFQLDATPITRNIDYALITVTYFEQLLGLTEKPENKNATKTFPSSFKEPVSLLNLISRCVVLNKKGKNAGYKKLSKNRIEIISILWWRHPKNYSSFIVSPKSFVRIFFKCKTIFALKTIF